MVYKSTLLFYSGLVTLLPNEIKCSGRGDWSLESQYPDPRHLALLCGNEMANLWRPPLLITTLRHICEHWCEVIWCLDQLRQQGLSPQIGPIWYIMELYGTWWCQCGNRQIASISRPFVERGTIALTGLLFPIAPLK
jgi:hypothetical protein